MKINIKLIAYIMVFVFVMPFIGAPLFAEAVDLSDYDFPIADYYKDPNVISDETFFGVWDSVSHSWSTAGKLNYDEYPALGAVESKVKQDDYPGAKKELLSYYRKKFGMFNRVNRATGAKRQYLDYELYKNNIMIADASSGTIGPRDLVTVDNDWGWTEVDLTGQDIRGITTFIFMALKKDDSTIEIKSSESGRDLSPQLEVTVGTEIRTFYPTEEAVISAGANKNKTSPELRMTNPDLKVSESATSKGENGIPKNDPVDENTYRTYMKFNVTGVMEGSTVSKVVLKFNARNAGATGEKEMLVFGNITDTVWSADTFSWMNGISHSVVSWEGDLGSRWYANDMENRTIFLEEQPLRFQVAPYNIIGYYQTTKDPEVMYQLARNLIYNIIQWPRGQHVKRLDTGVRAINLPQIMSYMVDCDVVTGDVFVGLLKYVFTQGQYLTTILDYQNNWGTYETRGLFTIALYFDEFITRDTYRLNDGTDDKITGTWEDLCYARFERLSATNTFPDGAAIEASLGYNWTTANNTLTSILDIILLTGRPESSMRLTDTHKETILNSIRYIMDMSAPGFKGTNVGDGGGTGNYTSSFKRFGELLNAPDLIWAGAGGTEATGGKAPNHKSVLYPVAGRMAMRSDWSNNGLFLFMDNDRGRTNHGHRDDLSVVVNAYGQYLLADPGNQGYDSTDYNSWLAGTSGHNTVMINNLEQEKGPQNKVDTDPDPLNAWETNDGFDFVSMSSTGYMENAEVYATRDVFFVRNKFWILDDWLMPIYKTDNKTYEQLWHFRTNANLTFDRQTQVVETRFPSANIKIIPVGIEEYAPVKNFTLSEFNKTKAEKDEVSSGIKVGYYGGATRAEYASHRKVNVKGDAAFHTILFPVSGTENYDVAASKIELSVPDTVASAMKIDYTQKNTSNTTTGIYYNQYDKTVSVERTVGMHYTTDGHTAYLEKKGNSLNSLSLMAGTHVKDLQKNVELIKSNTKLEGISVEWQGPIIYLYAGNALNMEDFTVYCNGQSIAAVYLNDELMPGHKQQGQYVYYGDSPIIFDDTDITPPGNGDTTPVRPDNTHDGGGGAGGGGGATIVPPTDVKPPAASFYSDIEPTRWSVEYIKRLSEHNILSGYQDGTFLPEREISRDEFLKVILEGFGIPIEKEGDIFFDDVTAGAWNENYIKTGVKLGIIKGVSQDYFGVGQPILRQDMATIMIRTLDFLGLQFDHNGAEPVLNDYDAIASYAVKSVETLAGQGIITGNEEGYFLPLAPATREQAAKIIYLTLNKLDIMD